MTQPHGVTDAERDEAYRQWIQGKIPRAPSVSFAEDLAAGIEGLQGIIQYQVCPEAPAS